jgi:hypothetical protein
VKPGMAGNTGRSCQVFFFVSGSMGYLILYLMG